MLRYFPPFPSPNPSALNNSPFENAPVVPSPPGSDNSSTASLPSPPSSTPSSPLGPTSPTQTPNSIGRARSRSAARRSVPPHTRIIKKETKETSAPNSPPITPPLENSIPKKSLDDSLSKRGEEVERPKSVETTVGRKKSIRTHNYEDAVRIACGAWCESSQQKERPQPPPKKKTVSWDSKVPA
ncbi:hypothetical protein TWF694_000805 [Orbilia ellipsospora]|uniref:Uncharacterized protein n=1 Tax=Orbilia ellipsospora TaxID=2528407 RepID=A0AAV9XSA9_9PEZI